jgi:hypothetical protein
MFSGRKGLRGAFAAVLAAVVVLVSPGLARAETEPNDALATATPIFVNGSDSGTLTTGDQDYYRFSAQAGHTYVIEAYNVSSSLRQMTLYGYNSAGSTLDYTSSCNGSGNVCARIQFTAGLDGDHYLRLKSYYTADTGSYSVRVLPSYDAGLARGTDGEPDDALALAEPIAVGMGGALKRTVAARNPAYSTNSSDQDYFHFTGKAGHTYVLEAYDVSMSLRELTLYAYSTSGSTLDYTSSCNGSGNVCARVQFTAGLDGEYFLRVKPYYNADNGTYSVRVLPRYDEGLTRTTDAEPDDALALAQGIDVGLAGTLSRTLSARNPVYTTIRPDTDYFHFEAQAGRTYVVEVFGVSASIRQPTLYAYDTSGSTLTSTSSCNAAGSVCARLQFTAGLGGDHYLRVGSYYGADSGTYSIRILSTPTGAGAFVPLTPARLLDTRTGVGRPAGVVPAGGEVDLQVSGRGGVPSGASSVALNVTVTSPTRAGNITVYPAGSVKPVSSNLNFRAAQTIPNLVVARLGTGGRLRLANNSPGSINLIADVTGYYVGGSPTAAGSYVALSPSRVLDTRTPGEGRSPPTAPGRSPWLAPAACRRRERAPSCST